MVSGEKDFFRLGSGVKLIHVDKHRCSDLKSHNHSKKWMGVIYNKSKILGISSLNLVSN